MVDLGQKGGHSSAFFILYSFHKNGIYFKVFLQSFCFMLDTEMGSFYFFEKRQSVMFK